MLLSPLASRSQTAPDRKTHLLADHIDLHHAHRSPVIILGEAVDASVNTDATNLHPVDEFLASHSPHGSHLKFADGGIVLGVLQRKAADSGEVGVEAKELDGAAGGSLGGTAVWKAVRNSGRQRIREDTMHCGIARGNIHELGRFGEVEGFFEIAEHG